MIASPLTAFAEGLMLVLPLIVLPGPQLLLVASETTVRGRGAGLRAAAGSIVGAGAGLGITYGGMRLVTESSAGLRIVSLLAAALALVAAAAAWPRRAAAGAPLAPVAPRPASAGPWWRGLGVGLFNPAGLAWCSTVGTAALATTSSRGWMALGGFGLGMLAAAAGWLLLVVFLIGRGSELLPSPWYRAANQVAAGLLGLWGCVFLYLAVA